MCGRLCVSRLGVTCEARHTVAGIHPCFRNGKLGEIICRLLDLVASVPDFGSRSYSKRIPVGEYMSRSISPPIYKGPPHHFEHFVMY